MENINQKIAKFVKYYAPVILLVLALDYMGYNISGESKKTMINHFSDVISSIGVIWFLLLVYLFFAVAFQEKQRSKFVRWLAGIKENDEREAYLTGVVSKKSFIAVTGALVLMLLLSALRIGIYRVQDELVTDRKHGAVQLGLALQLFPDEKKTEEPEKPDRVYYVNYKGLPLAGDGIVVLILALQLGVFYYYSRKEILE